jgi:glutamate formiminotransferase/formiminotetrahydrofolate cyclodeaminase
VKREGDSVNGKIVKDEMGNPLTIPGTLKSVKAIGWYIEEYGIAQISMNLTNLNITPLHIAFDEVCRKAEARGIRVTGSELVGLIPLKAMLDAGKYFLRKQKRSSGVSEKELIRIAVLSMGLDELAPFKPEEKIIEYLLKDESAEKMIRLSLSDFADETAGESPAPGGGSVAAYLAVLGASLGGMVANLSANKKGWEGRWKEFSDHAEKAEEYKKALLQLVDADTKAFQEVMQARALPKSSLEENELREKAIEKATAKAIDVPFRVMKLALDSMQLIQTMALQGNPNSVSDAGVAAICARSAVLGAALNVRINAAGKETAERISALLAEAKKMEAEAVLREVEILQLVNLR